MSPEDREMLERLIAWSARYHAAEAVHPNWNTGGRDEFVLLDPPPISTDTITALARGLLAIEDERESAERHREAAEERRREEGG